MIRVNGSPESFVAGSVADLIERLTIEPRGIAVAINGEVVRRTEWSAVRVEDHDVIEIVTAVAGG